MDILNDATKLPDDPSRLPDDTAIGIGVWAALQGVKVGTVHRNRVMAESRRGTPDERPGDMPAEDGKFGTSPYWHLSMFRRWEAGRPGKGAGAGRPVGTGQGRAVRVKLPFDCPHCRHEITAADMTGQDAKLAGSAAKAG